MGAGRSRLDSGCWRSGVAMLLLLCHPCLCVLAADVASVTVFLSVTRGNDGNIGSPTSPIKTLSAALHRRNVTQPNLVVVLEPGVYSSPLDADLVISGPGSVHLKTSGPGVVFDLGGRPNLLSVSGPSLSVQGVTVQNAACDATCRSAPAAVQKRGVLVFGRPEDDNVALVLLDCSFLDNEAVVGAVVTTAFTTINNCSFVGNRGLIDGGAVVVRCEHCLEQTPIFSNTLFLRNSGEGQGTGGAVHLFTASQFVNCSFELNKALSDQAVGGAVRINTGFRSPNTLFRSCVFRNNSAPAGGALCLGSVTRLEDCVFISNYAGASHAGGGAVFLNGYAVGRQLTSFVRCVFSKNHAAGSGAAVYLSTEAANFDQCMFEGSFTRFSAHGGQGGAVFVNGGLKHITTLLACVFHGNVASVSGGATSVASSTQFLSTIFEDNAADQGGGGAVSSATFTSFVNCTFRNNSALSLGGAVEGQSGASLTVDGSVFLDNLARPSAKQYGVGGAVAVTPGGRAVFRWCHFLRNTAPSSGGAVALPSGNFSHCNFTSNTVLAVLKSYPAEIAGGGIFFVSSQESSVVISSFFLENSAPSGGAIGFFAECPVLVASSVFRRNLARGGKGGGAVSVLGGSEGLMRPVFRDSIFEQNRFVAAGPGTGLFTGGGVAVLWYKSTFLDCTLRSNAAQVGGALLAQIAEEEVVLQNTSIIGNQADNGGGIALVFNSQPVSISLFVACTIVANRASKNGGGVFGFVGSPDSPLGESRSVFSGCTFSNNRAEEFGGSAYLAINTTFFGCQFAGGTAAPGAGGEIYVDAFMNVEVSLGGSTFCDGQSAPTVECGSKVTFLGPIATPTAGEATAIVAQTCAYAPRVISIFPPVLPLSTPIFICGTQAAEILTPNLPLLEVAAVSFNVSGPPGTVAQLSAPLAVPVDPVDVPSHPPFVWNETKTLNSAAPATFFTRVFTPRGCSPSCHPQFAIRLQAPPQSTHLTLSIAYPTGLCTTCSDVLPPNAGLPLLNATFQVLITLRGNFYRSLAMSGQDVAFSLSWPGGANPMLCPGINRPFYTGFQFVCYVTPAATGWYEFSLLDQPKLRVPVVGWSCPFGANCSDVNAGQQALEEFWCDVTAYRNTGVTGGCVQCLKGACCPSGPCPLLGTAPQLCSAGRQGKLCGECLPGYSAAMFSPSCLPNSECDGYKWIVPVVVLASFLLALYYVLPEGKPPSTSEGLDLKIVRSNLLQFYQLAAITMAPVQLEARAVVASILSFFSLDASSSGDSTGICLVPNVSILGRVWLQLAVPAAVFLMWGPAVLFDQLVWQRRRASTGAVPHATPEARYVRAVLMIATTAYASVSKATFSLLHCVQVGLEDSSVLLVAGQVTCYRPWQFVLLFLVVALCSAPLLVLWAFWSSSQHRWLLSVRTSLSHSFSEPRRMWFAVLLGGRLAMSLVGTFVQSQVWRAMLITITALILHALQIWGRPFKSRWAQHMATMVASRGGVDTAFHTAMARLTLALLGTPLVCGVAAHAVLAAFGAKQRCGRMGMGRGTVDKRSSGLSMSLLQSSDTRDQNTRFAP